MENEELKQMAGKSHAQLEKELLATVNWGLKFKIWLAFLVVVLIVCLGFYVQQLNTGLGVTGLNDYVSWGVYISNFVFFVATSLIGMLITSILGMAGISWVKPISRIAETVAVAFAMVAGLIIISDMGRPDRLLNVFKYGRIQSPIVWDIVIVSTYVTLSILLLYLPLIPDLALMADKSTNLPVWQRKLYKVLSLGWRGSAGQVRSINKKIGYLAVLIIPVALGIHTVTSWLFAMTLRAGWDSPIFGPYFVSGAFVAGCASVTVAMYFYRQNYKLKEYITELHFDKMGKLLVLVSLVYLYFNINEIIVPAYKLRASEAGHIADILWGHNSLLFWMVQIFGLVLPFLLLLIKPVRKPLPITIIASFILVGAWIKRYLIVVPVQLHPYLPIQNVPENFHNYSPTLAEIMITTASFVLVLIIITLISKLFPVIPIWEMKHELKNSESHA